MKERPILMSAPMIRAILDGTKMQTRRAMKVQPIGTPFAGQASLTKSMTQPVFYAMWEKRAADSSTCCICPYGVPGDRLWVRETFQPLFAEGFDHYTVDWQTGKGYDCRYVATDGRADWIDGDDNITDRCKPGIHMPRWASRITLEVTGVRVERLQDISRGDAMAEGCPFPNMAAGPDPRKWYAELWDQISGPGSWDENPWVWVVEFKTIRGEKP